jgi:hypothetical protein
MADELQQIGILPEAGGVAFMTLYSKTGVPINVTARAATSADALRDLMKTVVWAMGEYEMTVEKPAPPAAPVVPQPTITVTDETGVPVIDAVTGKPMTAPLPEGVRLYTVAQVFHDKTKSGKDVLKVITAEEPYNTKYGVSCFHPSPEFNGWKTWQEGEKFKYAPPAGAGHVLIRAPQGEGKYADVLEFRP